MKKIILFTTLLFLICLPVFSQENPFMKFGNKGYCISSFENNMTFYSAKSFDFTSFLNDSVYKMKLFIPKIPDTHIFIGQVPTGKHLFSLNIYNMPCIKLIGILAPMPVMRPEQWIQYSLLIKDK